MSKRKIILSRLSKASVCLPLLFIRGTKIFGATLYVNPGESIQVAVDQAGPGDEVIVREGS